MKNEKVVKLISVICAALMFVLTLTLVFQFVKIGNMRNKQTFLNDRLSQLEQQISDYTNENNYISSNQFLEEFAREVLGWGKDNEMIFK